MIDTIRNTQALADRLKPIIDTDTTDGAEGARLRRRAHALLTEFERAGWYPQAFDFGTPHGAFAFAGDVLTFSGASGVNGVIDILARYLRQVEPRKLYSTDAAAKYVGVSIATFKRYVHQYDEIAGEMIGNSLVFQRDTLDSFTPRERGGYRERKHTTDEEQS